MYYEYDGKEVSKLELLRCLVYDGWLEVVAGDLDTSRGWVTLIARNSGKVANINKEY